MRHVALALLLIAAPAAAQDSLADRLREQLRSTVTQLRELQGSQATLEAGKAAAEAERDALKARLGSGESAGAKAAAARELAAARSQNAALGARANAAASELATANARVAALGEQLRAAQAEAAQQRGVAATSTAAQTRDANALQACADRNARLVTTGRELVALHRKRYGNGLFPPLQLLRTRIENEAQAMGDRVAADAMAPAGPANK